MYSNLLAQPYTWFAQLKNNSMIEEFDKDGKEFNYNELPKDDIVFFGLKSNKGTYQINLKTGQFYIEDSNNFNKILDIKIPVFDKLVKISGSGDKYDFYQLKQVHYDSKGGAFGPAVLEFQLLGYKYVANIPKLGPTLIDAVLKLEPGNKNRPMIQIYLRKNQGGALIQGSPFNQIL